MTTVFNNSTAAASDASCSTIAEALTQTRDWRTPVAMINPSTMHLWPEEPQMDGTDRIKFGATLELGSTFRKQLWYSVDLEASKFVTQSCDPFVLGAFFIAAANGADLLVHGQVSPSLLRNLIDFQNAWKSWWQHGFSARSIDADKEAEDLPAAGAPRAICAYSGGVDSNFTIYRHKLIDIGRQKRNIEAALLIHGLDLPLKQNERFERITANSKQLLNSVGINLITLKTNFREINPDWNNTHGAALASALMLFKKQFSEGIIASTYSYDQLLLPWGSNPISDPLMSSKSFEIVHDAPHWARFSKLAALSHWPAAYDKLRVCFELDAEERNCGKCFKCICTWLGCKLAKVEAPASLPAPTAEAILALRNVPAADMFGLDNFGELLENADVPAPILHAFKRCLNHNRRRHLFERKCSNGKPDIWYRFASKVHSRLSRYFT